MLLLGGSLIPSGDNDYNLLCYAAFLVRLVTEGLVCVGGHPRIRVVCQIRPTRFLLANPAFTNSCKRCKNSSHPVHDTLMHFDSSRGIKNYGMHCHASPCVPRSNLNTRFLWRRRQSANLYFRFRPRVVHGSRCCGCLIVSSHRM
jgi:hypothetical protein